MHGLAALATGIEVNPVRSQHDIGAGLLQLAQHVVEEVRVGVQYRISPRSPRRPSGRSRFLSGLAVPVTGAAQALDACYGERAGTHTVDPGPMAISSLARSPISGSMAQFSSTVVPSARSQPSAGFRWR